MDNTIAATSTTGTQTTKKAASQTMDKNAFLQLLVAQLKNQDPMEPLKNEQFLAQLAQFSQLEATQNLEKNGTDSANLQAAALVGMTVTAETEQWGTISGKVESVKISPAGPLLNVGGVQVSLGELQEVKK